MENTIKLMEVVYFQSFDIVDKKNHVAHVIKGHGLTRKCNQTKEELAVLMKRIDNLET